MYHRQEQVPTNGNHTFCGYTVTRTNCQGQPIGYPTNPAEHTDVLRVVTAKQYMRDACATHQTITWSVEVTGHFMAYGAFEAWLEARGFSGALPVPVTYDDSYDRDVTLDYVHVPAVREMLLAEGWDGVYLFEPADEAGEDLGCYDIRVITAHRRVSATDQFIQL